MIRFVRRTVRFSEHEDARYHKAAEGAGVEFSEWVRRACEALALAVVPGPGPATPRSGTVEGHAEGCICLGCTKGTVVTVSGDHKEV